MSEFDQYLPSANHSESSEPKKDLIMPKTNLQKANQCLVHSYQCRDPTCQYENCTKMKKIISHAKNCKSKSKGGCQICTQMLTLFCYHSKHCQNERMHCGLSLCKKLKQKLQKSEKSKMLPIERVNTSVLAIRNQNANSIRFQDINYAINGHLDQFHVPLAPFKNWHTDNNCKSRKQILNRW